jgi:outer membrane protein OmpA-like peptidoglycan-associated protein
MVLGRMPKFALSTLFVLVSACGGTPAPDPATGGTAPAETTAKPAATAEEAPAAKPAEEAPVASATPTAKPAEEPAAAPAAPEPMKQISCEPKAGKAQGKLPKLAVEVDKSKVDLENGKLEVKLTRPACKVELKVFGDSGKTLAEVAQGFDGAAAGTALVVQWSVAQKETIARIEVWGYDTEGSYVGVALTPWNVKIDHEEVNFENDSDAIRASEVPKLEASLAKVQEIVGSHKDLKGISLYIAGHTDTVGDAGYNLTLSRRRAKAIAAWFRGHGLKIPVAFEGFGEHAPVVKTGDEVAEPKNRRVDYILSLEPPKVPQGSVAFGWKGI